MNGYVIDHAALLAGLGEKGPEHDRREMSRLIHDAVHGGPRLNVPALCLAAAAADRPAIATHVAGLVMAAPPGVVDVHGLTRANLLDALQELTLGWPAAHAAFVAVTTGRLVVTVDPRDYAGTGADAVAL